MPNTGAFTVPVLPCDDASKVLPTVFGEADDDGDVVVVLLVGLHDRRQQVVEEGKTFFLSEDATDDQLERISKCIKIINEAAVLTILKPLYK